MLFRTILILVGFQTSLLGDEPDNKLDRNIAKDRLEERDNIFRLLTFMNDQYEHMAKSGARANEMITNLIFDSAKSLGFGLASIQV